MLIILLMFIVLNKDLNFDEYLKNKNIRMDLAKNFLNKINLNDLNLKETHEFNGDINIEFLNINNYFIISKFYFGKNKKEIYLIVDTGSYDLWLTSEECSDCSKELPKFKCDKENYCEKSNKSYSIDYLMGSVKGNISKTLFYLEDLSKKKFLVNFYNFLLVDKKSKSIKNTLIEGLIGLGFKSILNTKTIPLYLERPYLTLNFKNDKNKDNFFRKGILMFSKNKPNSSNINWIDNINQNLFMSNVYYILIEKELINRLEYPFIFDSGTSFIYFPKFVFKRIINIFEDKNIKCDYDDSILICKNKNKNKIKDILPNVTFRINYVSYVIKPEHYIDACVIVKDNIENCIIKFGISNSDYGIFGLSFLSVHQIFFDYKNNKIGILGKNKKSSSFFFIIVLIVLVILLIFVYNSYFKKKEENQNPLENSNYSRELSNK